MDDTLAAFARRRNVAQRFGAMALIPFIGLLVWHGIDHRMPLFPASFAGFIVALLGIAKIPKDARLALREANHEYAGYYFPFPLFVSITLLTKAVFFDPVENLIRHGTESLGPSTVAFAKIIGSSFLSAILDNNVVADFASRALGGLPTDMMHLFAMAQIAGCALGGCWTDIRLGIIGARLCLHSPRRRRRLYASAVDQRDDPYHRQLLLLITVLIYLEGALFSWLQ